MLIDPRARVDRVCACVFVASGNVAVSFTRAMCNPCHASCVCVVQCAEALGAIGSARSLPVLQRGAADARIPRPSAIGGAGGEDEEEEAAPQVERNPLEVRETCAIALDLIRWKVNGRQVRTTRKNDRVQQQICASGSRDFLRQTGLECGTRRQSRSGCFCLLLPHAAGRGTASLRVHVPVHERGPRPSDGDG